MDAKELIRRHKVAETEKSPFNALWQECGDFALPNKADFVRLFGLGDKRRQQIFDGTAESGANIFASSIVGLLANPASVWFRYETLDKDLNKYKQNAVWLDYASKQALNAINQSKAMFYAQLYSTLLDIGVFGTGGILVQEGVKTRLAFKSYSPSQMCIYESAEGDVDTVFVKDKMTIRQVMQNQVSRGWIPHEKLIEREKTKPDDKVEVLYCIYPRADTYGLKRGPKNMPVASVWIDVQNCHIMHEGGFEEHALPVARWDKATNEVWGRSAAMVALADIKTLNASVRAMMLAAEKNLNPPLQVPSDGTYGDIDLSPGAVNAIMTKDGMGAEPIGGTNGNLPFHLQWEQQKRDAIRAAFYVDQLQIVGSTQMTATEVITRQDEKMRMMAPMLGRIQSELIGPIVERVLGVLMRNGHIAPAPESLQGQEVKAVYVSPLTRAQRGAETQGIISFFNQMAVVAASYPDAADNIDADAATRLLHEQGGVPAELLKDPQEVQALRQQKQQMQQAQMAAAAAQQGVDIAKTAKDAGIM